MLSLTRKEPEILGLILLALAAFVLVIGFVISDRLESEKLCRHTIQRSFGKSSEEAQTLMDETKEWESR